MSVRCHSHVDGHCVLAYMVLAVCSNWVEIVRKEQMPTNVPYLRFRYIEFPVPCRSCTNRPLTISFLRFYDLFSNSFSTTYYTHSLTQEPINFFRVCMPLSYVQSGVGTKWRSKIDRNGTATEFRSTLFIWNLNVASSLPTYTCIRRNVCTVVFQ